MSDPELTKFNFKYCIVVGSYQFPRTVHHVLGPFQTNEEAVACKARLNFGPNGSIVVPIWETKLKNNNDNYCSK